MAKRRRRDDERKIQKSKRKKYGSSRRFDGYDDDQPESSSSRERRPPRTHSTKRKDIFVIVGAIIVIVILASGYLFYTNYFNSLFGLDNEENGGSNNNIVPNPPNNNNGNNNGNPGYNIPAFTLSEPSNPIAIIEVRDYGVVVIELYRNYNVQLTVDNFLDYSRRGFYDGLIFHRVIDGFMIQGGGFNTDLTQKDIPNDKSAIPLEIDPALRHLDGAVAMARTNDPNSATSQFFIDDGPQPSLEPGGVDQYGYSVFGQVVAGMEIVRAISAVGTHTESYYDDVPVDDVIINKIYEYTGPI